MSHPDWKRRVAVKRHAMRKRLTVKAIARDLGVPEFTVYEWVNSPDDRKRGRV